MSGNLNPVLLQCFLIRTKNLITVLSRNRWEPPARKTSETFGILLPFFKIFKIYCGLIFEDSRQLQSFKGLQVNKGNSRRPPTKFVELTCCIIIESFSRATFIKAPQILLMKVYYRGGGGGGPLLYYLGGWNINHDSIVALSQHFFHAVIRGVCFPWWRRCDYNCWLVIIHSI